MEMGASSFGPPNIVDLSIRIAPLLELLLSTSVTTGATNDKCVPTVIGTIDAKSGAHSKGPYTDDG